MPFLPPGQQRQSTEGNYNLKYLSKMSAEFDNSYCNQNCHVFDELIKIAYVLRETGAPLMI